MTDQITITLSKEEAAAVQAALTHSRNTTETNIQQHGPDGTRGYKQETVDRLRERNSILYMINVRIDKAIAEGESRMTDFAILVAHMVSSHGFSPGNYPESDREMLEETHAEDHERGMATFVDGEGHETDLELDHAHDTEENSR